MCGAPCVPQMDVLPSLQGSGAECMPQMDLLPSLQGAPRMHQMDVLPLLQGVGVLCMPQTNLLPSLQEEPGMLRTGFSPSNWLFLQIDTTILHSWFVHFGVRTFVDSCICNDAIPKSSITICFLYLNTRFRCFTRIRSAPTGFNKA